MSETMNVSYNGKPCYDILFTQSFDELKDQIDCLGFRNRRIVIITDSNVQPVYGKTVQDAIQDEHHPVLVYEIPAGEDYKNLNTVHDIYAFLIAQHLDRHDLLIALGGGVTGDITGFCAATYLRGISFIQIPTTLLAQTDSSVGGKTGVDFEGYKNMIGAFYMPSLVYINISVLSTLDARQYASGFAEVMKYGLIKDQEFYSWLVDHIYEINDRDAEVLLPMIRRSCEIKKEVVEKDPTEKGERALLNYGHTIGHAIEKARNFELFHGECVALGSIAAAYISWQKGLLSEEDYYEIRDMFVPFGLPISVENIDPDEIMTLMKSDKKEDSGTIRFILLKDLGKGVIHTDVTENEIRNAINEILYVENGD
ncbi:MAG: 3-dehydroquinate synthase [Butyrivibrio sp.]|nr:3-dehydroquinate synthase [Butyrivibrio sp.]